MAKDDPERRRRQSLIIARALLALAKAINIDYHPGGQHIGAVFGEALVGCAVFVSGHRRPSKPVSGMAIERLTGMPRSNVRRYAAAMEAQGILIKHDDGYTFNPDYIARRQSHRAVRHATNALLRAARELEKLVLPIVATVAQLL